MWPQGLICHEVGYTEFERQVHKSIIIDIFKGATQGANRSPATVNEKGIAKQQGIDNPLLRIFKPVTPSFLVEPLVPLFIAWFFFMIRFYLMPWLLGYSVMGMLSFPLEGDIARMIYKSFGGG